jgi:hypothetical protein
MKRNQQVISPVPIKIAWNRFLSNQRLAFTNEQKVANSEGYIRPTSTNSLTSKDV